MRPTQLEFRSPNERTGDFTDKPGTTYMGEALNFQSKSKNKKSSILPKEERFQQYKLFRGGNHASAYLGPGTYNDHETYLNLNKMPCPSLMVILLILDDTL